MARDRRGLIITAVAGVALGGAIMFAVRATPDREPAGVTTPTEIAGRFVVTDGSHDLTHAKDYELEVEIEGFHYRPTVIEGEPGHQALIGIGNETNRRHTFTVDGMVDQMIPAGGEAEVLVTLPEEGKGIWFYCRFHEELGMRGVLGDPTGVKKPPSR